MGSQFYYFPDGSGDDLEVLDAVVSASDVHITPVRDATVTVGGTGKYTNVLHGAYEQIRIVIELGDDADTAEKFQTFENFIKEGNTVAFAFDPTQAYLYVLDSAPPRGALRLSVGPNQLSEWGSSEAAVGHHVVIQSPLLSYIREYNIVSARVTGQITVSRPIQRSFQDEPVLLRHKWFFPALMLAPNQRSAPLLTHDHGFAWVFDATFWEDIYALSAIDQAAFSATGEAGATLQGLKRKKTGGFTVTSAFQVGTIR